MLKVLKVFCIELLKTFLLAVFAVIKLVIGPIQAFHKWWASVDKSFLWFCTGFFALVNFAATLVMVIISVCLYVFFIIAWPITVIAGAAFLFAYLLTPLLLLWVGWAALRTWYRFRGEGLERRFLRYRAAWERGLDRLFAPIEKVEFWLWELWAGKGGKSDIRTEVDYSKSFQTKRGW